MSSALSPETSSSSSDKLSYSSDESENLEKRVSSSSGYSTLVTSRIIDSGDTGIASIINGISSASKPNS
jgi:hypothetical protein